MRDYIYVLAYHCVSKDGRTVPGDTSLKFKHVRIQAASEQEAYAKGLLAVGGTGEGESGENDYVIEL